MPGKRVWVIGDIHGMADPLHRLLRRLQLAERERPAAETTWVFLGDYIDYGPSSRQVLDTLLALRQEAACVFLAGNHEDMLMQFLRQDELYERFGNLWLEANDGAETAASLTDDPALLPRLFDPAARAAITPADLAIPPRYRDFIETLAYAHSETFTGAAQTLRFAFCHGLLHGDGDTPGGSGGPTTIEEQLALRTYDQFHNYRRDRNIWIEDLHVWNRDVSLGRYGDYILVHGHTPTVVLDRFLPDLGSYVCSSGLPHLAFEQGVVTVRRERGGLDFEARLADITTIDIDTGAVYGKCLTALRLDEEDMLGRGIVTACQVRMDCPHRHGQDYRTLEFRFR